MPRSREGRSRRSDVAVQLRTHWPIAILSLAMVALASVSWAYWPPPNQELRRKIEELKAQSLTEGGREAGVAGLMKIISDDSMNASLRDLAIMALGDVGTVADAEFLLELSQKDGPFKNAANAALWRTRLNMAKGSQQESAVLEQALGAEVEGKTAGSTRRWAAEVLCDRGQVEEYQEEVGAALRIAYGAARGGEEMEVCAVKASVLRVHGITPDAYIAALEHRDESSYRSLHGWALDHLERSDGPRVVEALKQFAVRMQASENAMDEGNQVRALAELLRRGVGKTALTQLGLGARRVEEAEYLWAHARKPGPGAEP